MGFGCGGLGGFKGSRALYASVVGGTLNLECFKARVSPAMLVA